MGVIVLDIGTSSMRGILYDNEGEKLFTRQASYSPVYMEHDWVEQNPADWRQAMELTMKACSEYAIGLRETVEAVSVTSQRSSVIPIGEEEIPIGNAIMWQDKRVLKLLEGLRPYHDRVFSLTGSKLNPVFSGSKMMWIRECSKELYQKTKRLVVIPDYIIHEMTGQWVTDTTYGSRSLLMNLKEKEWDGELLELFHVEKEKLCRLIEPGSVAGFVTSECSKKTGLSVGTPVISAGGDQQCAALGLGIIDPGTVEISAGTGAYIIAASEKVPENLKNHVCCNTSAIPGNYVLESSIVSCASVFNWFLSLCYGMQEGNRKEVLETVNREMDQSLNKEDELLLLPFFQGRGTPDWNSQARGCFHNLMLGTERSDMARAVLEGLSFELSVNIDVMKGYLKEEGKVCACGGMMNSPVFGKILPAVLRTPVYTYGDQESTAAGAYMSAGVTMGLFEDYHKAFSACRRKLPVKRLEAELSMQERYQRKKAEYRKLYEKIYG